MHNMTKHLNKSSRVESSSDEQKAKISYAADWIWIALNIAFLYVWLAKSGNIFDQVYLDNGFCNHTPPGNANGTDSLTQVGCFIFDLAMAGVLFYFWAKAGNSKSDAFRTIVGSATYLVVHGSAHFLIFHGKFDLDGKVTGYGILILMVILAMGSASVYLTMLQSFGKRPTGPQIIVSLVVAILVDLAFTALFLFTNLNKAVNVLTYVNIAINLAVFVTRVIFVGPDNVEQRVKLCHYFYSYIITTTLMIGVMWIEPTMCSEWFAKVGGHVWFDVSLFALMFVGILNINCMPKQGIIVIRGGLIPTKRYQVTKGKEI